MPTIKKGDFPRPSKYGRDHYVRYGTRDQRGKRVTIIRRIYDQNGNYTDQPEEVIVWQTFEREDSYHSVILDDDNDIDVIDCNKDDDPLDDS